MVEIQQSIISDYLLRHAYVFSISPDGYDGENKFSKFSIRFFISNSSIDEEDTYTYFYDNEYEMNIDLKKLKIAMKEADKKGCGSC